MKKALKSFIIMSACLSMAISDFSFGFFNGKEVSAKEYVSYSFEQDEEGWSGRGGASVEVSTQNFYEGKSSLYVSGRTDSWNGCQFELDKITFTSGSTFSFSAAVYNSGKNPANMMMSIQYDVDGEANYGHIANKTVPSGSWDIISSSSYTLPENAENFILYFETEKGTSAFCVDDVRINSEGEFMNTINSGEIMGDLNNDNKINIADFIVLKNLILDSKIAVPRQADVNGDGMFNAQDVVLFMSYLYDGSVEFKEPPVIEPPVDDSKDDFEYDPALSYSAAPNDYFKEPCKQQGKVVKETYSSINGQKTLNVYLPYGYDESQKYNIFYIMHGGGENENTIFGEDAELDMILDYMIMEGKLEPMIVVTPTFNGGNCTAQNFYEEFRKDVIPFVEGKYSTYAESTSEADIEASRMHRAYGGFSMGSVSTWAVMANCLDYVAYYMPLSGDHWSGNTADDKAKSIVNAIEKSGYEKDEYFILAATGSDDIAYPNIAPQIEAMKKYPEFIYTSDFSEGNFYFLVAPGLTHWWGYVRHYVYDALPYFFHE